MARYKFDQIAHYLNEKRMPTEADRETYIGLEHLDSGNLTVTRWGSDVDIKGQKLVMHKGDILFGRRNTYLKRAAIAPHDGLFSAHGMIWRPKEDVVDAGFFPFFVSSDYFMDEAIRISVGSLSPTINWRDLKELEFDLPDIDTQRKLSTLLWAMERAKTAYKNLIAKTDELVKSQFVEMFGIPETGETEWPEYKLQALLDMGWITYHLDGNHGSEYPRAQEFVESGVPYISANCVVDGRIDFANAKYVTEARANRFRKGIAKNNDVLFAHNATVGPVAILETTEPRVILGTSLTAFRCNTEHILPKFLKAYLECPRFVRQYEAEMQQSTRKQVPITTQRKYTIVVPDIDRQKEITCFMEQADKSKFAAQQAFADLTATQKALMRQYLG